MPSIAAKVCTRTHDHACARCGPTKRGPRPGRDPVCGRCISRGHKLRYHIVTCMAPLGHVKRSRQKRRGPPQAPVMHNRGMADYALMVALGPLADKAWIQRSSAPNTQPDMGTNGRQYTGRDCEPMMGSKNWLGEGAPASMAWRPLLVQPPVTARQGVPSHDIEHAMVGMFLLGIRASRPNNPMCICTSQESSYTNRGGDRALLGLSGLWENRM